METLKVKLIGVAPLLMHSSRLSDKTNPHTRAIAAITTKKKKTDEDILEIKRLEWYGGIYEDENGNVAMPADNVLAMVIAGAKKNKNGQEAKAGVYEARPFFKFNHDGPKTIDKLWEDGRFCDYRPARVKNNTVMRARPIFRKWSVDAELLIDTEIMNKSDVIEALRKGGERCGLGDFRPRFGRFTVETV